MVTDFGAVEMTQGLIVLVVFQRTRVQFPAPLSGSLQLSLIPAPYLLFQYLLLCQYLLLAWACAHAHTYTNTHTFLKFYKSCIFFKEPLLFPSPSQEKLYKFNTWWVELPYPTQKSSHGHVGTQSVALPICLPARLLLGRMNLSVTRNHRGSRVLYFPVSLSKIAFLFCFCLVCWDNSHVTKAGFELAL